MLRREERGGGGESQGEINGALFLSAFPMFVPSLSWYMIIFSIKWREKCQGGGAAAYEKKDMSQPGSPGNRICMSGIRTWTSV